MAPTPSASSAGVASTAATKNPTLPPVAKTLMAAALSPAARRAALPAAGWNIATPRPDANSIAQTAVYPRTSPDSPTPTPARPTPVGAGQLAAYRSTSYSNVSAYIAAFRAAFGVTPAGYGRPTTEH